MGCNAIRTSHNPPAPELLDLCDRMGMLVMDESFDCWESGKTRNDYHLIFDDWHETRLARGIAPRPESSPIILWSIGNEVGEQGRPDKFWIAAGTDRHRAPGRPDPPDDLREQRHASRLQRFPNNEDVFGYNYRPANMAGSARRTRPSRCSAARPPPASVRAANTFSPSAQQSRGQGDHSGERLRSLCAGLGHAAGRGIHRTGQNPFVAGEFVWTGFDYLGEPTPYGNRNDPARSSYFGIVDLAGFPKDRYYIYQAHWRPDFPMAHILPHWNWPERVGQVTPVHVFTSGDSAELFLNGKSLGRKTKGPFEYRLEWDDVKYQPGTLKVVAYKNGKKWATDVMKTTGPASKLTMKADRANIAADGQDLSFITVTVADKHGLLVPRSKNHIKFSIAGPGEIVATDNGDATSFEPFQSPEHSAYNGLALVIVRAKAGQPGTFTVKAKADGLKIGTVRITSK